MGTYKQHPKAGGILRTVLVATLGASIGVLAVKGCMESRPKTRKPLVEMVLQSPATSPSTKPAKPDFERNCHTELSERCRTKSTVLKKGEIIVTGPGRIAKLVTIENGGALFLAGEMDKKAWVPRYYQAGFFQKGDALATLDPAQAERIETADEGERRAAPMVYICPERGDSDSLRLVSSYYGEIECAAFVRKETDQTVLAIAKNISNMYNKDEERKKGLGEYLDSTRKLREALEDKNITAEDRRMLCQTVRETCTQHSQGQALLLLARETAEIGKSMEGKGYSQDVQMSELRNALLGIFQGYVKRSSKSSEEAGRNISEEEKKLCAQEKMICGQYRQGKSANQGKPR